MEDELAALTNLRRQVLDAAEFKAEQKAKEEEAKAKAAAEDLMMGTPSLWAPRNVERAGLYSHVEAVASVTQAARARAKSPSGRSYAASSSSSSIALAASSSISTSSMSR